MPRPPGWSRRPRALTAYSATGRRSRSGVPRRYESGSHARQEQPPACASVSPAAASLRPRCGSKLLLESLRQPDHLLLIGFDDEIRGFPVEGIARGVEIFQALKGIGGLQKRPMLAAARALPQRFRR